MMSRVYSTRFAKMLGAGLAIGALSVIGAAGTANAAPAGDQGLQVCKVAGGDFTVRAFIPNGPSTNAVSSGCSDTIQGPVGKNFAVEFKSGNTVKTTPDNVYTIFDGGTQSVVCGSFDRPEVINWRMGGDPRC
ncbi:MucBP domain-containing protein [Amycolatopsis jejuensis]|uniref:MucBP domain-containing protein n=1 Tax=Amycolatopsis jejuensis TaxID=330084 RepID=UPI0005261CFD|nr:MucBP domain-containing protein [Amycolatopsis jejuensis]